VYGLVADVERYPEFLPWCTDARVLARDEREVTVTLGLASGIARASFTTRNRLEPDRALTMSLVDGPFDQLEGRWDFTPIAATGTRADLQVRFSTHGLIGAIALGPAFEGICNHLVDAFARRARQVFGGG
jgi:ribosome-associated toxin RatA of RatAB toxin-antitoxin module